MVTLCGILLVFLRCTENDGGMPRLAEGKMLPLPEAPAATGASGDLVRRAREDPIGLLEEGLRWHDRHVRDYEGIFVIQERINGCLKGPAVRAFRFRCRPFSLAMSLLRGPGRAARLLYVEGRNDGNMMVRPSGFLGSVLSSVNVDPHGAVAREGSLRPITDFGLRNALSRILKGYRDADSQGRLRSECLGTAQVAGRRVLTLQNQGPAFKVIVDLDVDMLLPVRIRKVAVNGQLLAFYHYKNLRLNRGFTDRQFAPEANGL